MSWNYRIMRRNGIDLCGVEYEWFELHEVYYDSDGKVDGYTIDAIAPGGDDINELKENLFQMMKAFNKPILEFEDTNQLNSNPEQDVPSSDI